MAPPLIQFLAFLVLRIKAWAEDPHWGPAYYEPAHQVLLGAPRLVVSTIEFLPTLLLSFVRSGPLRWCLWLGTCMAYLIEVFDAIGS